MAEGSELMHRLLSENADLKKQVRLLKENQMLKRLLSESCPDRCGLGGRDLFTKGPAYPEDGSPGSAGEAAGRGGGGRPAAGLREPRGGRSSGPGPGWLTPGVSGPLPSLRSEQAETQFPILLHVLR